jgi:hypothetical protein
MSLEMAHKVILPPQKNYIPQFLKQRDINSYYLAVIKKPSGGLVCRGVCADQVSEQTESMRNDLTNGSS